jgi:hypothetical protein
MPGFSLEAETTMNARMQNLCMAGSCLFFLLLSLVGIGAVLVFGDITGVDGLLMVMVCAGMALLFAWLSFSALQAAGVLPAFHRKSEIPAAAPAAAGSKPAANLGAAAKEEGK